jgi:Predicted membrane protein
VDAELLFLILFASVVGAALGTFSGLVPGIHVNTLAALMLSFYTVLDSFLSGLFPSEHSGLLIASCIVSAAVVHSSVDFVPSVFLGAPDPDEVMNMLPGHRLLMDGKGMIAVRSAAIGSAVGSMAAVLIAVPLQYMMSSGLSDILETYTPAVLITVVVLLIAREKGSAAWAAVLMMSSGSLGYVCMSAPVPETLMPGSFLFPLLTGLFGIPALMLSTKSGKVPEQNDLVHFPVGCREGLKGVLTGGIVGWFPGITASAGAAVASSFTEDSGREGFISLVSSIGSASAVFALVTLSVTGKGRSGTMLAVSEILGNSVNGTGAVFLTMLLAVSVAVLLGYCITISSGKLLSRTVAGKSLGHMNLAVIVSIVVLTFLMTGYQGMIILSASTALGLIPTAAGVSRVHLTGCLTVPAIVFYLNLSFPEVLFFF